MTITSTEPTVAALWEALQARVARGERFAGVFAARRDGGITLSAHVARPGRDRHAGGAAAAGRGELPGAHPGDRRRVLVRAGDPRRDRAWSPTAIPGSPR